MKILFPKAKLGTFPVFSDEPPSDTFIKLLCTGGSPVLDCELCGRTVFNFTGEFMDDGELDDLLVRQKTNPKRFISVAGEVYRGDIEGLQVVIDCPCNGLRLYENFILDNQRFLCEFIIRVNSINSEDIEEKLSLSKQALATTE